MKLKKLTACVLALSVAVGTGAGVAEPLRLRNQAAVQDRFAANPREVNDIGDPFIVAENGYHLFATGAQVGFFHWRSDDLLTFERDKALKRVGWVSGDFWAPEVYAWKGRYIMLFTGRWKKTGSLRIGIAGADAPEGPYTDLLDAPLFDFGYAAIDGTLVVDDAGAPYLIYSRDCSENVIAGRHESHLYGVRLADDLLSTVGEPVLLTRPDKLWEMASGDYLWNEGPAVLKHDGKYYLFYSANFYASREYGVGVAMADAPLGPYVKQANNPILKWVEADGVTLVSGPGHNSFFTVGEELFAAYHTHTDPAAPSGNRQLAIDRAGFHRDGTAYINGPTLAPQLRPLAELGLVNHIPAARCDADPEGLLSDGDTCQAPSSAEYVWTGSQARFTWENPVTADMLLLYPARGGAISGTATIAGQAVDFELAASATGEMAVIPFEPTQVNELEVVLREGSLGEVMLVGEAP